MDMYFDSIGRENTAKTVEIALRTARERGIRHIVVASNTGNTAKLLMNDKGIGITMVSHAYGFASDGENELAEETRTELEAAGIRVLTATHVLSGAERGIRRIFGGISPVEVIAQSLRMLGQGTKVCVEISVMALDSGCIPFGEPVVAVAGSSSGADTALIVTPAHAAKIFDVRINEVICKPSLYQK
ncbi:MAG: hypothetical protein H6Q58_1465 [Firmicutes bacterium]|nr:hypothetical protein [Bacillota bacterium]